MVTSESNEPANPKLIFLARLFGKLTAAMGFIALIGWGIGAHYLSSFKVNWIPMAPSTAVFFILLGAIANLLSPANKQKYYLFSFLLSTFLCLCSVALSITSLKGIYLEIEHLVFNISGNIRGAPLGHISPATAIGIALASFSLLIHSIYKIKQKPAGLYSIIPTILMLLLGGLLSMAYVFGGPLLYDTPFIPPAFSTSIALILLAFTILFLSISEQKNFIQPTHSTKLLLVALAFLAIGIIVTGYFYFYNYQNRFDKKIEEVFHIIAEQKLHQLENWREERIADASMFYENQNFSYLVEDFQNNPEHKNSKERLRKWLDKINLDPNFRNSCFISAQNDQRVFFDRQNFATLYPELIKEALSTLKNGKVKILDFVLDINNEKALLGISVPISAPSDSSIPLGILLIFIDPEFDLYPMLKTWPTLDDSAETLLFRKKGEKLILLSEAKNTQIAPLKYSITLTRDMEKYLDNANKAFSAFQTKNAAGKAITAFVKKVPDSNWFLTTLIESKELYKPAREHLGIVILLICLLLLTASFAVWSLWQQQKQNFYRRQNEVASALIESEGNLRTIFESMRDGILVAEAESKKFVAANTSISSMLGYSIDELLTMSVYDIHPPESLDRALFLFGKALNGKIEVARKVPVIRKDGSIFLVDVNANPTTMNNIPCALGVFRDITEQNLAEQRIIHLNAALNGIRQVNQLITRETNPDILIKQACKLLVEARGFHTVIIGLTSPDGEEIVNLAGSGSVFLPFKQQLEQDKMPDYVKKAIKTKHCVTINKQNNDHIMALALAQSDCLYGFIVVFIKNIAIDTEEESSLLEEAANDIAFALHSIKVKFQYKESVNALALTEEQLRQSQKLEAIGQLAGGIAHDFNNLLMVQIGYCELLKSSLSNPDQIHDIELVHECAKKAASLTRQLLAFSRKQTLQPEIILLNNLVKNL
ncbi:MAG: PAS domain S-box protein, partial [Candidatus Rifleibacteriota bacterium]